MNPKDPVRTASDEAPNKSKGSAPKPGSNPDTADQSAVAVLQQAAAASQSASTAPGGETTPEPPAEAPSAAAEKTSEPPAAIPPTAAPAADMAPEPTAKARVSNREEMQIPMNAMSKVDTPKIAELGGRVSKVLSSGAEQTVKNVEALAASAFAGLQGAEQVRAHLMQSATKAVEVSLGTATALANVKTAQEAVEIQQQFARQTLETYVNNARVFGDLLTSVTKASLKPITERYAEASEATKR